jgi:hypothetical protein
MTTTKTVDAIPADREPIPNVPPPNWQQIMPRYRIVQDVAPPTKERFSRECPFSTFPADQWQFGERAMKRGEVIETGFWPAPGAFFPLNYSAKKVLEFFNSGIKSRMARSPWRGDRLVLDDGVTSSPYAPTYVAPQLKPMDLRPVPFNPKPVA